jgi:hypothetical protein
MCLCMYACVTVQVSEKNDFEPPRPIVLGNCYPLYSNLSIYLFQSIYLSIYVDLSIYSILIYLPMYSNLSIYPF